MKWLDDLKMSFVLFAVVAVIVLGGGSAKADFTFGEPTNLTPLADSGGIWGGGISPDGLSLYFASKRSGGYGGWDIWVLTRPTTFDPWGAPVNLGPMVNSACSEILSSISADGLSLYINDYQNPRPGGYGNSDIWVSTRETTDDDWGLPINLGPMVNSAYTEIGGVLSTDGLSLYLQSNRPGTLGGCDMWVATRETTDDDWGEPVNLGSTVNSSSSSWDGPGGISTDGLVLFFDSSRPGSHGGYDVWVTIRPTTSDPWSAPVNLGPAINTSANDWWPSISRDGSTLYFLRAGSGMWQAPIVPIVDLNGDEIVDAADMVIMVDHWGENYSLCDIGPTPLGDGIVDVHDLIVLAGHLFEEIFPPGLVAYWKLDEEEGDIAYNSIGDNHGILSGYPSWQTDSGQVVGALEFDGIDDYVETGYVLNPADGVFSVFTWIKGGAPGQVILSQGSGAHWLMADVADGALRTDLRTPETTGRDAKPAGPPLICSTVVTDGDWHRAGFVRNGSDRVLYVDGIEVARDTAETLESASGGLYIGAASALEPGTFFSGLIDDIRIYNRVVDP